MKKSSPSIYRDVHALADGGVLYLRYSTFLLGGESYIFLKVKSVEIRYWLGRCSLLFSAFFVQKTQIDDDIHIVFFKIKTNTIFYLFDRNFTKTIMSPRNIFQIGILPQGTWPLNILPYLLTLLKKEVHSMTSIVKLELAELMQCRFLPTILCGDFFHW